MLNADVINIRKFEKTESSVYRDLRLAALQESPDAFGSTFDAEQTRTRDVWTSRLQAGCNSGLDFPLLALVGTTAAGLAWGKVDGSDGSVVHLWFSIWPSNSSICFFNSGCHQRGVQAL